MEFFEILKELKGVDGAILIAMSIYIVKLLNNHLVHSFSSIEAQVSKLDEKIESQITKIDEKLDKLPCRNGECR